MTLRSSASRIDTQELQPGDDLPQDSYFVWPDPKPQRRAGVLLHPTSLPGKYGIGEIGREAKKFVDWLEGAGAQLWQVLPLVPPDSYWSPYNGLDALCGNPLLIPLEELVELGLLQEGDLPKEIPIKLQADFSLAAAAKSPLLEKAATALLTDAKHAALRGLMTAFREANPWVEQSALFSVLCEQPDLKNKLWWDWQEEYRDRKPDALADFTTKNKNPINTFIAIQFLFDHFWMDVKHYANSRGVRIVGDIPIYVGGQSTDVWVHRQLFELGPDGKPNLLSGMPPVPPNNPGQLWGSPVYNWKAHRADKYRWWVQRFQRNLKMYDEIRLDHFRGFAGYWAVNAESETAMNGKWKKGPGIELFEALEEALGDVPILAEDLGMITKDVVQLREAIGAPGMVVLQFAWGRGPKNPHLPINHYENCFVYPGTHDNHTCVGWWKHRATAYERGLIRRFLGLTSDDIAWCFIQESMKSIARTAIVAMQDIMRLDDTARMNTPGKVGGNWSWRVGGSDIWDQLKDEQESLRKLVEMYDRYAPPPPRPAAPAVEASNGVGGAVTVGSDPLEEF